MWQPLQRPWETNYGDAARRVLALVSGMPAQARARGRLLMLQAYVDESCSDSLFVMAGFISNVEGWMAFSDEWASLLSLGPPNFRRINKFHQVEMANSQVGLEQSELFFRLIEKHLKTYVSCSIRLDQLKRVHESVKWPPWVDSNIFLNEYFICFFDLVYGLASYLDHAGMSEPIDLIFDENTNKTKCLQGWDRMKAIAPDNIRTMLGDTPSFKSSATTMALQAADQIAYWDRKTQLKVPSHDTSYEIEFPWQKKAELSYLYIYSTEETLRERFNKVILASTPRA
jgi:hypothetical protein